MGDTVGDDTELRLLITAEEAFPALEELFLGAEDRIIAGFRIFDPATRLRSEAGRAIGEDWFDLITHVLAKGVRFELLLSDFDPIIAAETHRLAWFSVRQLVAAAEIAGPRAQFRIHHGLHPAELGLLPRVALWHKVRQELCELRDGLNKLEPPRRRTRLRDMPGLGPWLAETQEGYCQTVAAGPPTLFPASHHQKLAVIDGKRLYIGGLDLNERRWDTKKHERPGRETWHDIQVIAEGPVAATAERYLAAVPDAVAGRTQAPPEGDGLITTVSARRAISVPFLSPRRLRESIDARIKSEIRNSEKLIYIETQFFRDRAVARELAFAAKEKPDLQLLMVLPAAPEDVAFNRRRKLDARYGEYLQWRCVRKVRRAFGPRAFFASPALPLGRERSSPKNRRDRHFGAPLVYVHAKMNVFDDRAAIISSANLNGRSLHWDTEAGLHITKAGFAEHARRRALSHWLPREVAELAAPVDKTVRTVALHAARQARKPAEEREGFLLPYDSRPAEKFGQDLMGIPEEMV